MLADHRIESIEVAQIRTRYPRTVGRNARLGSHGAGFTSTAVLVRTEQGASGWGVAAGDLAGAHHLIGRDLVDLFDPEIGVIDTDAHALDFALHDLAGRILQRPLHALLGGAGEGSVSVYSGAIYFDDLDPEESPRGIDAILANCAADWACGYRAFKLKIGRGYRWMDPGPGLRRDVQVTRAVREAYPSARILVDANDGYRPRDVVRFLTEVADCDLFWIEEPFPEEVGSLRTLRDYLQQSGSGTLVADGEFRPEEAQLLDLASAGLIDVLLMDVVDYGLTAWRRIMPVLRDIGVVTSPHAWGMPLKSLYAAQFAAGLGNVLTVEGVPGTTDGVDSSAYVLDDGILTVPETPGIGLELTAPTRPLPAA